jgi:sortase A
MKKFPITSTLTLILMLTISAATPVSAAETVDGPDAGLFGRPTSVDEVTTVGGYQSESDNINRSKDSAFIPPPFGSPSSDTPGTGELLTPYISGVPANPGGYTVSGSNVYVTADSGGSLFPSSSVESGSSGGGYSGNFTLPDALYYADGSIGTLSIPKLNVSAKVYEEESLENLKKGIGHFKSTSCWDGNVGFAAHNRGAIGYFGEIHTLRTGDRITYTTKLGTRTYEVYFVGQIEETDFTRLGRTDENIVSLFTCVRDISTLRVCVQARQVF